MIRKLVLWALAVGSMVLAVGCCGLDHCKTKYNLVPQPPDGKPIILSRGASGEFQWLLDGGLQPADQPAGGVLRDDFIGTGVRDFYVSYTDMTGNPGTFQPTEARFTSNGHTLRIRRTPLGFGWTLDGVRLEASGQNATGTVPAEFVQMLPDSFDPAMPAGKTFVSLTLIPILPN